MTPDRIAEALPRVFSNLTLVTDRDAPGDEPLYAFAIETRNFVYRASSRSKPGGLALIASRLPADVGAADAVRLAAERHAGEADLEVEAQDLSSQAAVPFALVAQVDAGGEAYVLAWGARGGRWLYTVIATSEDARQGFVRRLVTNLGGDPDDQAPVTGGSSASSSTACELVELYPGYPGYRGFVTGLDGVGDHACLRDLKAADPGSTAPPKTPSTARRRAG